MMPWCPPGTHLGGEGGGCSDTEDTEVKGNTVIISYASKQSRGYNRNLNA